MLPSYKVKYALLRIAVPYFWIRAWLKQYSRKMRVLLKSKLCGKNLLMSTSIHLLINHNQTSIIIQQANISVKFLIKAILFFLWKLVFDLFTYYLYSKTTSFMIVWLPSSSRRWLTTFSLIRKPFKIYNYESVRSALRSLPLSDKIVGQNWRISFESD